jgi:hypothetical protein
MNTRYNTSFLLFVLFLWQLPYNVIRIIFCAFLCTIYDSGHHFRSVYKGGILIGLSFMRVGVAVVT